MMEGMMEGGQSIIIIVLRFLTCLSAGKPWPTGT